MALTRAESQRRIVAGLVLLVTTTGAGSALAQPSAQLGFGGSYRTGVITGTVPVYQSSADCGVFTTGTASSWSGNLRVSIPGLLARQFGFILQLGYERSSGRFEAAPKERTSLIDPETGQPVTLDRVIRLDFAASALQFDVQVRYDVTSQIALSFGPWGGYRTDYGSSVTDNVLGPGDIGLGGGSRSVELKDGQKLTGSRVAYGVTFGGSYQLPLGSRLGLTLEPSLKAEISPTAREATWRRFVMGMGASLVFDLFPRRPGPVPTTPTLAVEVPAPSRQPRLEASIRLNGVDDSGRPVRVTTVKANEVLYRRYIPFLPAIFFENGESAIAARYLGSDSIAMGEFSPQTLHADGALDLHRYNLALLGSRLREYPAAKLYVWGSVSMDEPSRLIAERIEALELYLQNEWGIPRSRMVVSDKGHTMAPTGEATDDGREENRRVEFWSSDPAVMAPITSDRIVRDFNPPAIALEPRIDAEAGVKRWRISIRQAGSVVATYSSDDSIRGKSPELAWNIADEQIDSLPAPICAEFEVEDSTGAIVTARDELPLLYERRVRIVDRVGEGDIDRISHTLVAFDYNVAEPRRQHLDRIAEIAATVDKDSRITVTGYTDRIGGEGYNVDLSRKRADRVVAIMREELRKRGKQDVTVASEGAGIESRRFSNDSPEGRILSRGVQIVVELSHKSSLN